MGYRKMNVAWRISVTSAPNGRLDRLMHCASRCVLFACWCEHEVVDSMPSISHDSNSSTITTWMSLLAWSLCLGLIRGWRADFAIWPATSLCGCWSYYQMQTVRREIEAYDGSLRRSNLIRFAAANNPRSDRAIKLIVFLLPVDCFDGLEGDQ